MDEKHGQMTKDFLNSQKFPLDLFSCLTMTMAMAKAMVNQHDFLTSISLIPTISVSE